MFIVSLTYKVELPSVEVYLDEHKVYLEKYYALDKLIVSGRKVPRTGGILLVNAADVDEVNKIIKEDPFYKANIAHYEVIEFIPTMTNKKFEALKSYI